MHYRIGEFIVHSEVAEWFAEVYRRILHPSEIFMFEHILKYYTYHYHIYILVLNIIVINNNNY